MTKTAAGHVPTYADAALRVLPVVSTLGFAGLVVTVAMGFEEPTPVLLGLSSVALVIPVLGAFAHLALTRELTPQEKRAWLRDLIGPRALWSWSSYLMCSNRREAASTLAQQKRK